MEELRLRMEQRIWRIKVLKIRERKGRGDEIVGRRDLEDREKRESSGQDDNVDGHVDVGDEADVEEDEDSGTEGTDVPGERRVLRSRRCK